MSSDGWETFPLGSLCKDIFDGPHATPKKTQEGPIFLGISNLANGRIDLARAEYLSEKDFIKWTRRVTPQPNDLVFSYETRLGEAALIPDGLRCCLGRRMGLLRFDTSKVDPQFMLYAYLGPEFQQTIRERTVQGSTVERIPLKELSDFPITIPNLPTQRRIADILSALDDKIELNRQMNATLEAIAQAIFKEWFVDFNFPGATGEMVESELGLIPQGWKVGALGEVCELAYGKGLKSTNRIKGEFPVVGSNGIVGTHNEYLVRGPGIVIGRKGTIGEVIWLHRDFYPIDTTFYIKDLLGVRHLYFHYFLLKEQDFKRIASDSAVPGLNRNQAYENTIVIPPIELANYFNDFVSAFFENTFNTEQQSATLVALRDALLPKLMSGEIVVGAGSVRAGSVRAGSVRAGSVRAGSVRAGSEPAPTRPD